MAGLYTFPMSALINFYNVVAETSLERMQEMAEAIQNRRYQPSDFITDALGFWVDGANGWLSVVQQTVAGPVPFVFLKMRSDEETASDEVAVTRSGRATPEMTPLARLGRSSDDQAGTHTERVTARARWAEDKRNCLVVEAQGLNLEEIKSGGRLAHGLYQASVHLDEKLLAIVQVLVED